MKTFKLTFLLVIITQSVISQTLEWSDITPKDYHISRGEYNGLSDFYNKASVMFDGRIIRALVDGVLVESADTGKTWQIKS